MLFVNVLSTIILAGSVGAIPFRVLSPQSKRDVNPALVPSFGWQSGVNPDGEYQNSIALRHRALTCLARHWKL
jgi:hypothetical protein